jgi:PIN domain nuclease of toxin-antitoxin system
VKLLLDTHTVIWWVDQDRLLGPKAHAAIADSLNDLLLSAATIWEIAIKVGLGKLSLSMPYKQWINRAMTNLGAVVLPITVEYADVLVGLPLHHRDPFDRMLIAQTQVEHVSLVSGDATFDQYGVSRLW